jgi:hypothetical protein
MKLELFIKLVLIFICAFSAWFLVDYSFLIRNKKTYDRLMLIALLLFIFAFVFTIDAVMELTGK